MKKSILALPLVVVALGCQDRYEGQAGAASSPAPTATPESSMATPVTGAAVSAVVVSVDPAGRTVTLREVTAPGAPAGNTAGRSYNVSPSAAASLGDLKAGDEVNVMCETAPAGTGALADCVTITTIAAAGGTTSRY
jgi:hypothetical protein